MPALATLPIDEVLAEISLSLEAKGACVLLAPPGAGKTTRVPPALAGAAGRVVVLEPRRVAARAAARRIADERGWTLGREVGWWIRFERRFGVDTAIVFATEGVLLRWLQRDPFLEGVSCVVFDEFHERTLASDLALALTRKIRAEARPDLRIVVMSATLDPEPVADFLGGAPIVRSAGRAHPVEIRLLDRLDDARVAAAVRRAAAATSGDLLVFLPGLGEIRRVEESLGPWAAERDLALQPLHGDLPIEQQDAALRPSELRRVVLATNVAETSVTVQGVRTVVDSGLARQLRFDPASGLDRLDTIRISRAAADQRAGRAGREGPGLCLRLWTAADDLALRPFETPEVQRADLSGAILELAAWGETDPERFAWFEAPDGDRLGRAMRELRDLGALDDAGLTAVGRRLAELPLPPRLGRLVLEGERLGVAADAALAAALLSERDPFRAADATARAGSRSDLADRLAVLDRRRHRPIFDARDQILRLLDRQSRGAAEAPHSRNETETRLQRAIAAAYLDRLCRRREPGSERAVMVGGRGVRLGRGSAVRDAELFVAVALDSGRAGQRSEDFVRLASIVERDWLPAESVTVRDELDWDTASDRVVACRRARFDDLVIEEKEIPIADPGAASALLAERAAAELDRALPLDERNVATLLGRLRLLARQRPDLDLATAIDAMVRAALPILAAGKRSFAELRRAPLAEALLGSLSWPQRKALDEEAPERFELPSGLQARIDYSDPERPVLAVRIQELFGLPETPRLAGGAPLLLHLLAPNGRPQQVTDDLASFWRSIYPLVRKELAGRYPKHAWPENPLTARPGRKR